MTTGPGQGAIGASGTGEDGWDAVRADDSIQFEPIERVEVEPEAPGFIGQFFEWLGEVLAPIGQMFGAAWPIVYWLLIIIAVGMLLFLLYRLLEPVLEFRIRDDKPEVSEWVPEREEALALLSDADRLAAEGRFDEATHLLLKRSVGQISAARPDWVEPSSTARELASLSALPEPARVAFGVIAERVERSLFALRSLGQDDWQAARAAYADFALQKLTGGAA